MMCVDDCVPEAVPNADQLLSARDWQCCTPKRAADLLRGHLSVSVLQLLHGKHSVQVWNGEYYCMLISWPGHTDCLLCKYVTIIFGSFLRL